MKKISIQLTRKTVQFTFASTIIIIFLVFTSSSSVVASTNGVRISSFDFTLLDGSTANLSDYAGKPVIIDWAASWCSICAQNQVHLNQLYPEYKDLVNFLSISYGGSNDDLTKLQGMKNKGPYNWTFALDHENKADEFGVRNGYVWVLSTDLELVRAWNYTIAPVSQLQEALNSQIPEANQPSTQLTDNPAFLPLDNPVFIVFAGLAVAGVVAVVVLRIRKL
ncbi:MAG: peroxiredoxin family protein [Candidatus Odinarchaeota archaeon]